MNTAMQIDLVTQLQAIAGGMLAIAGAVDAKLARDEPDMHRKVMHALESGAGTLEGRVLFDPPTLILLVRVDEDTSLEVARLAIPQTAASRH
jgi:hypothetical protein